MPDIKGDSLWMWYCDTKTQNEIKVGQSAGPWHISQWNYLKKKVLIFNKYKKDHIRKNAILYLEN
jgi:hypothetical protein